MVVGGEVDSKCFGYFRFSIGPITFIFLTFPIEKALPVKLFDVSIVVIVYFWYGKRCYFKVIKNGGWWGGGWSEMRLATFIAFCLFQIFKRPITFIF